MLSQKYDFILLCLIWAVSEFELCVQRYKGVLELSKLMESVASVLVELPWSIIYVNTVQNLAPFFANFQMLSVEEGKRCV